jgi:hypothetical protein
MIKFYLIWEKGWTGEGEEGEGKGGREYGLL